MQISTLFEQYLEALQDKCSTQLLPSQLTAIRAIKRCRTPDSGELYVQCADCEHSEWRPMSCGHRSCPKCQNHEASLWLERQTKKLLPVEYFMVTFTLPAELRTLAWRNQTKIYTIMFDCVSSTLKDFGLNPKNLGADVGMTAVLHTHSRKLDYHPHIHVVVPGGGIDKDKRQWIEKKGKYLFNQKALAKVFRARLVTALKQSGLAIPAGMPKHWIVDCSHVGKGLPALKYLSRYLYRGVISEKNIISNKNGLVTFKYTESKTKKARVRSVKGEDFLWLLLRHVLPRGFRRVRDYGFLHGNAKKLLVLVQLVLRVVVHKFTQCIRPVFKCCKCKSPMNIVAFRRATYGSG
jgi:hypothetical protein